MMVDVAQSSVPKVKPLLAWLPTLVSIGAVCATFGVLFWQEIVGAVAVWIDSTAYNHCFLVLPLVGVLLWNRRDIIRQSVPRPSPGILAGVPFLSALWVFAALLGIREVEQILIVALFEVILISVLGWRVYRVLLAPLLFLFFLVPFGAFLVPVLQRFTATFTIQGLQLFDIPVFADGFIIQIPEGTYEIAEACAGLRFLIASIVFGCFFASIMYCSQLRRLIFITLSIVVPIIANGLRALGIILLGHFEGSATAIATDHVLYGWVFFSLVTLLLIAAGMMYAESTHPLALKTVESSSSSRVKVAATTVAGLLFTLIGPAFLMTIDRAFSEPVVLPAYLGPPSGGWIHITGPEPDWMPVVVGTKWKSLETYRNGDARVSRFIGLYPLPTRDSAFTSSFNSIADLENWSILDMRQISVPREGTPLLVNAVVLGRQSQHRLVWWFYLVDDDVTCRTLQAKLLQLHVALQGGSHLGTFFAISTRGDDIPAANAVLTHFLEATDLWRVARPR